MALGDMCFHGFRWDIGGSLKFSGLYFESGILGDGSILLV